MNIDPQKISKSEQLPLGDRIVIINCMDNPKTYAKDYLHRNIYRVRSDDSVIWQVADYSPMGNSTFVNLYWKGSDLYSYNFDGIEYLINTETGFATPKTLLK
jgi:hypothetical protein